MTEEEIEEVQKSEVSETGGRGANFLALVSPEGMTMLGSAVLIDLTSFFPWLFLPDLFFGCWLMIRGSLQSAEETSRRRNQTPGRPDHSHSAASEMPRSAPPAVSGTAKTAKKSKWIKWLRPIAFIGELIPFINSLPLWTVLVYSELVYNS